MLDDEQDQDGDRGGVDIITVPARLGQTYAVWVPGKNIMVIAADTREQQLEAIMKLTERLLRMSAGQSSIRARSD